jgi:hypothetical protein
MPCTCHNMTFCPDLKFSHYEDDQPVFVRKDQQPKRFSHYEDDQPVFIEKDERAEYERLKAKFEGKP